MSEFLGIGGRHRRQDPDRRRAETSDEWLTPKWILDRLGAFDLDPCASKIRPWPTARQHLTIEDDGLAHDWEGRVWCNPPYGREAAAWLAKMVLHGEGTVFLFARTETEMFHKHVWPYAHSVLFLRGRVDFHKPDGSKKGNAGGPSVLIAYGDADDDALATSGIPGVYLSLRLATAAGGRIIVPGRCTLTGHLEEVNREPLLAALEAGKHAASDGGNA